MRKLSLCSEVKVRVRNTATPSWKLRLCSKVKVRSTVTPDVQEQIAP